MEAVVSPCLLVSSAQTSSEFSRLSVCAGAYHSGSVIMSCPERACASAAAVSISLSPCEVTKSIVISTFSLSAHALQSLVMASLAPGTQWSQKATLSLPAACVPRTKGAAANAVVAIAAVPSTRRRVIVFSAILPFLEAGTLLGGGGPTPAAVVRLTQARRCWRKKKTRDRHSGHGS